MRLSTPEGAGASFELSLDLDQGRLLVREPGGASGEYTMGDRSQDAYVRLFEHVARDFGFRLPVACEPPPTRAAHPLLTAVLTEPVAPEILYGYGDPCVVRVADADYRLLVTSNDAPDAFPILASSDLKDWRLTGFVFPRGATPPWALAGAGEADFWAPEMHRVGDEWWVCFTARAKDGTLAIGFARSRSPDGPFVADEAPLVGDGVIDPHILIDAEARPWLVWKKDDNDVWPGLLNALLRGSPELVADFFVTAQDRRSAAFVLTLRPWIATLGPMEQFFAQQPLMEAVAADVTAFAARSAGLCARLGLADPRIGEIERIVTALRTRIFAQRLSGDGRRLEGERTAILQNDLPWEGHLIEGVWITEEEGRYYLLYAGNDFTTGRYGIGAAVAEAPTGPYRKGQEAFLSSTQAWWGPGHPSVASLDDGRRQVFLHAYRPGEAGYKRFRALLTAPISFRDGEVRIGLD